MQRFSVVPEMCLLTSHVPEVYLLGGVLTPKKTKKNQKKPKKTKPIYQFWCSDWFFLVFFWVFLVFFGFFWFFWYFLVFFCFFGMTFQP